MFMARWHSGESMEPQNLSIRRKTTGLKSYVHSHWVALGMFHGQNAADGLGLIATVAGLRALDNREDGYSLRVNPKQVIYGQYYDE